jgi:putative membrane protein
MPFKDNKISDSISPSDNDNVDVDVDDHSQQFLANERTFLAWFRTSITLIGLGFIVSRFSLFLKQFGVITKTLTVDILANNMNPSYLLGIGIIILGIGLLICALKNYLDIDKSIQKGIKYVPRHSLVYTSTIAIIIFGVIIVVYLSSIL